MDEDYCSHPTETRYPKFGSDDKTDVALYVPREHEKVYDSHNKAFWGEQGSLPSRSEMP